MSETAFVLIAEQDPQRGESLAESLRNAGHACRVATSTPDMIESVTARPPDVLLADDRLAGLDNNGDALGQVRSVSPYTELVLMIDVEREAQVRDALSSHDPVLTAECIQKPIDLSELRRTVQSAADRAEAARNAAALREQRAEAFDFEGLVGSSPILAKEIRRIKKLARSKSTVLIIGESGTGKELVARALHIHSPRAHKPFLTVNCAAISESLLESELFGHVKGAFTGAVADKKGIFEAADGGTVFLDEIGDMPLAMQAKLLRVLENGEVLRVGTTELRIVNVRFVAATHQDLWEMVQDGEFREDVFYRLHAQGAIRLPPLRNRREDIPLLAHHFLEEANRENERDVEGFTPEVLRRLTNHSWRGNVRELKSVIEQMVIETDNKRLTTDDLPAHLQTTTEIVPTGLPNIAGLSMADVERLHILNTLKLAGGNREKAAKMLKIGARTLYRKLKDYGVT